MASRHKVVPVVLLAVLGLGSGCGGPSCESACEKVFTTCNLTFLIQGEDTGTAVSECMAACDADMNATANQSFAVGWVACVDEFACDPADEGIPVCVTCQSGYYVGQSGRGFVACQVEGDGS